MYGDDIPVGTEVSNKEYSEEISITQYPFSSFETFKAVVKEYLGEDYDVIESSLHDTEYPDEDPRHIRNAIWVVSNYKKHIVWNYMVLVERIPHTGYYGLSHSLLLILGITQFLFDGYHN